MALTAGDVRDTQIPGVHETDELRAFVVKQRIGSNGVGGSRPKCGVFWLDVRALFGKVICVSTVAIGATDVH
jgi:hypothetical protein